MKRRRLELVNRPLRCVWTSYPHHEENCHASVPVGVAVAAWQREMHMHGTCEGFFYIPWEGELWLAYGLSDGSIRGIYCPAHRAQREERTLLGEEGKPLRGLSL